MFSYRVYSFQFGRRVLVVTLLSQFDCWEKGTAAPGTIYWKTNTSATGRLKWFATFGDLAGVPGLLGLS